MKIKEKIQLFLPVLSIALLVVSYNQFTAGYDFKKQLVVIDSVDLKLSQEMQMMQGTLSLKSIDENIEKFKILIKSILGKITISSVNSLALNDIDSGGIDKIGEFRDLVIKSKGDYLQQIYLLKQINESMRHFVIINKMQGTNKEVIINARIYGNSV